MKVFRYGIISALISPTKQPHKKAIYPRRCFLENEILSRKFFRNGTYRSVITSLSFQVTQETKYIVDHKESKILKMITLKLITSL